MPLSCNFLKELHGHSGLADAHPQTTVCDRDPIWTPFPKEGQNRAGVSGAWGWALSRPERLCSSSRICDHWVSGPFSPFLCHSHPFATMWHAAGHLRHLKDRFGPIGSLRGTSFFILAPHSASFVEGFLPSLRTSSWVFLVWKKPCSIWPMGLQLAQNVASYRIGNAPTSKQNRAKIHQEYRNS